MVTIGRSNGSAVLVFDRLLAGSVSRWSRVGHCGRLSNEASGEACQFCTWRREDEIAGIVVRVVSGTFVTLVDIRVWKGVQRCAFLEC